MLELATSLSGSSTAFRTTTDSKVWVRLGGTFGGTTVAMEESLDNSTFATFNVDGTDETFTQSTYKLFSLPGGVYFRFTTSGGSPAVNVHISGSGVAIQS